MLKRFTAIALTALVLLSLCACSPDRSPRRDSALGRMVQRIDVAIHPDDPDYARTYVTQEKMNALLNLLRYMETADFPEVEPDPEGGQTLYTATVTFTDGAQSVYQLLGHTYLKLGDNPWCIVSTERSMKFSRFILEHPSDAAAE